MGKGYLVDTNIVVYYLEGLFTKKGREVIRQAFKEPVKLSVISKIELLAWDPPKQANKDSIKSFTSEAIIIGLDDTIIENTVQLRKNHKKVKLPDAIIAATCIAHDLTLITRNASDFMSIKNLDIINPFTS